MSKVRDYVSDRVFDGTRPVSEKRRDALRESYRKALRDGKIRAAMVTTVDLTDENPS